MLMFVWGRVYLLYPQHTFDTGLRFLGWFRAQTWWRWGITYKSSPPLDENYSRARSPYNLNLRDLPSSVWLHIDLYLLQHSFQHKLSRCNSPHFLLLWPCHSLASQFLRLLRRETFQQSWKDESLQHAEHK